MNDTAFARRLDRLRPLDEADLAQVLVWRNSPAVRCAMFTTRQISEAEHAAWFKRLQHDSSRRTWMFEADETPMGIFNLTSIDTTSGDAQWGFYVRPGAPKGMGTRLGRLALAEAFGPLSLRKLVGEVLAPNAASLALHRKLGFEYNGVRDTPHHNGDTSYEVHLFALTRASWLRSLAAGDHAAVTTGQTL
jgi:UDP-4-amino-4,6-dideoxy-N-acetyl-beta-L-altrosamine N-acetyltransferase